MRSFRQRIESFLIKVFQSVVNTYRLIQICSRSCSGIMRSIYIYKNVPIAVKNRLGLKNAEIEKKTENLRKSYKIVLKCSKRRKNYRSFDNSQRLLFESKIQLGLYVVFIKI